MNKYELIGILVEKYGFNKLGTGSYYGLGIKVFIKGNNVYCPDGKDWLVDILDSPESDEDWELGLWRLEAP